jgi:hypothetical protein
MAKYIQLHNAVYINVDLIKHHEAFGDTLKTKVIFDAYVDDKPLELVLDVSEVELVHMMENAKEYELEPGFSK